MSKQQPVTTGQVIQAVGLVLVMLAALIGGTVYPDSAIGSLIATSHGFFAIIVVGVLLSSAVAAALERRSSRRSPPVPGRERSKT